MPEADGMAQCLGPERKAHHADIVQPREHLLGDRVRGDLVEQRVAVHEERRLERLQAGHAEDVPGACRDDRERVSPVDYFLRGLLIERARMPGAAAVGLPVDVDTQPSVRQPPHLPGEFLDLLARRRVRRIVGREPKRHDPTRAPSLVAAAAAARTRGERQQCDHCNATNPVHVRLPSSNSRPKGRSRARPGTSLPAT